MRPRPALLTRLLDAPSPAKAALSTASTAAAFPLHQAERVLKHLRGAAEFGVRTGLHAATRLIASSLRRPDDDLPTVSPPVPAARPTAPPRPLPEPADEPPTTLHVAGEDVFNRKSIATACATRITQLDRLEVRT